MTNIDFLKAVLNKQFELVGCKNTTDEVIKMNMNEQADIWNSYKITKEQHQEWRNYFMEIASENDDFKEYENKDGFQEVLDEVFETISKEWSFEIIEEGVN